MRPVVVGDSHVPEHQHLARGKHPLHAPPVELGIREDQPEPLLRLRHDVGKLRVRLAEEYAAPGCAMPTPNVLGKVHQESVRFSRTTRSVQKALLQRAGEELLLASGQRSPDDAGGVNRG